MAPVPLVVQFSALDDAMKAGGSMRAVMESHCVPIFFGFAVVQHLAQRQVLLILLQVPAVTAVGAWAGERWALGIRAVGLWG